MKITCTCTNCGKTIDVPQSEISRELGRAGRGKAKRRNVDYAALARNAHKARARNKAEKVATAIKGRESNEQIPHSL